MLVGREELGVFAAEIEGLVEERHHGREIIRRPRAGPGLERGGAVRIGARDVGGRNPARLLEIAGCDADQASVVGIGGQAVGIGSKLAEEAAERRIDGAFMRQRPSSAPWRERAAMPRGGM